MPAPRRLHIALDVDVVASADRNIHQSRWEPAVKAAIEAASQVLADALVDDDISLVVQPYYEWKYNWSESRPAPSTWGL